ncbi:FAD/NAD(P)-binding domain containing protein [Parasponia andersonii]|uniref:FAD/NAD(P)-binding domain containing protein n=1 Tax=Parasponia andersonii TaxID=3476 RepID=A0A2P5APX2_PARAD|nr:FAD/NAD(P)-binding domain containing protein [Parasponia andersonii]
MYDATDLPLEDEHYYDYIVIGGGTAGCPLAATLSEKYSVLVLERGGAPNSHVLHFSGFFANLMQEEDNKGGQEDTPA